MKKEYERGRIIYSWNCKGFKMTGVKGAYDDMVSNRNGEVGGASS